MSERRALATAAVRMLAAGAFGLTACRAAPPAEVSSDVPAMRVRDSAGVRLVSSGFAASDSGPLLSVQDTLLNGAQSRDEAVIGLGSLQPLGDSSFVFFSASGPALWLVPRDGEAPVPLARDSIGARALLLPWQRDSLLLWDAEAHRLSRVTAAGVGIAVTPAYASERLATISGALEDGTLVGVTITPPGEHALGHTRAPAALLRFAADGAFVDTLREFRGPERVVQAGPAGGEPGQRPMRALSVPFGRATLWTVGRTSVLLFDTERCDIERVDAEGRLLQRLDIGCPIEAVTERDKRQFLAEVLASARSRADSTVRRRFVEQATFPPTKATASGLLTDAWDRIWVRRPVSSPDEAWRWQVFEADGTPIGTLRLGRDWRIAAVRDRELLVVANDREDAPPVVARVALPAALAAPR
ncbi:MAG TPA: hypothetical protein PKE51_07125 [Gemmatimonadaceae bacterium]|nr:hypothetical protein [Gemmatimonadaceae bacterium]